MNTISNLWATLSGAARERRPTAAVSFGAKRRKLQRFVGGWIERRAMNSFALTIMAMWFAAAIGTAFSKDSRCFGAALVATILMGIGYAILRGH